MPTPKAGTRFTPQQAVQRLEEVLAHAWMVRTFLKHAPEIAGHPEMLAVPRTLFDSIRAVEPARQRGDFATYLRRIQGKLPKIRQLAQYFNEHYAAFSPHTNYAMAALSLRGVVRSLEEILQQVDWEQLPQHLPAAPSAPLQHPPPAPPRNDPLDSLEIPEV
jgi:hypothetical protein